MNLTPDVQADRMNLRRTHEGGIHYARRPVQAEKHWARNRVLHHFRLDAMGGSRTRRPCNFLTMPGLEWRFERALIDAREHGRGRTRPRTTYITAIESSQAIFAMGMRNAPGAGDSLSTAITCPPFARAVAKTYAIQRYYLTTFERIATEHDWVYDGAWIDLTGPVTLPRLDALAHLWSRTRTCLVVTSLNARWPAAMGAEIAAAGGLADLLMERLDGSLATENFAYRDTSPMSQITLHRLYGMTGPR